jgi:hypothetical protein
MITESFIVSKVVDCRHSKWRSGPAQPTTLHRADAWQSSGLISTEMKLSDGKFAYASPAANLGEITFDDTPLSPRTIKRESAAAKKWETQLRQGVRGSNESGEARFLPSPGSDPRINSDHGGAKAPMPESQNEESQNKDFIRRNEIMKTTKLVMLVMTIAVGLFILIPNLSWAADDGAGHLQSKMRNVPRR